MDVEDDKDDDLFASRIALAKKKCVALVTWLPSACYVGTATGN